MMIEVYRKGYPEVEEGKAFSYSLLRDYQVDLSRQKVKHQELIEQIRRVAEIECWLARFGSLPCNVDVQVGTCEGGPVARGTVTLPEKVDRRMLNQARTIANVLGILCIEFSERFANTNLLHYTQELTISSHEES